MTKNIDDIKQLSQSGANCGVNSGDIVLVPSNSKQTLVKARLAGVHLRKNLLIKGRSQTRAIV